VHNAKEFKKVEKQTTIKQDEKNKIEDNGVYYSTFTIST